MYDLFNQPSLTVSRNAFNGNQVILNANRLKFSGQAKLVLDLLLDGQSVSSVKMLQHGILDTRARIYSLNKLLHISIPFRKLTGGQKEWYLTSEQINQINNLTNEQGQDIKCC